MIVQYIGETDKMVLTNGKNYEVIAVERGWYRLETDLIGDYLFPPELFRIIEQ